MAVGTFLKNQWSDYPRVHRDPVNLVLHCFAVPMIWAGLAALVLAAVQLDLWIAAAGAGALFVSVLIQGGGHALEKETARAFSGPGNFALRLTTEALFIFPAYILSGRAFRK